VTSTAEHTYVFDNENAHSREQHRCLAAAYDPATTTRLLATGIGPGWRCLEVGAGGGSVARWLTAQVVPTGEVLATDLKPTHLSPLPGLTVQQHDVVTDPLPENAFDLIHARLVLLHLPDRLAVLAKLVRALKPGGWLQLDEFDISYGPCLLAPSPHAAEVYERFLAAKVAVMETAGADGCWGRRVPTAMRAAGLTEISTQAQLDVWRADSPGLQLLVHHTHHLRDALVAAGQTDADLAEVRAVMADPAFRATACPFYTVQGRRPR
jgi:SAM-dependent methyltransferase